MMNTKRITALFLVLMLLMASIVLVSAQGVDKNTVIKGDSVAVAHYNVASDTYEVGTVLVGSKTQGGTYLVLNADRYVAGEGEVSDTDKNKIQRIKNDCETVMAEHTEFDLSRFGAIDSESYLYTVTVSPYVVPLLLEQNAGCENNIWLAMGNGAGKIRDVYITLSESNVISKPTEGTPSTGEEVVQPDDGNDGENVTVSVVTPKKMSIRLQDGTILKNGDGFTIRIGQELKFQMCSNNWDNDTYDDMGNGIAGTVVYTVKVSDSFTGRSYDEASKTFTLPKGDLVLRTDVNKCFMAYRYHFTKGDYNKQTGIVNVVNTPLESLSVNLPLGSTVTSDAYAAWNQIDHANVFIETAEDKTLSYTDYFWAH